MKVPLLYTFVKEFLPPHIGKKLYMFSNKKVRLRIEFYTFTKDFKRIL